jgi:hypothetical protein
MSILRTECHLQSNQSRIERNKAFFLTWLIVTIISLLIIVATYFIDSKEILLLTPNCSYKVLHNSECALCGMTRAFIKISSGDIKTALSLNRASVLLYFSSIVNLFVFISATFLNQKRRLRLDHFTFF